MAAFLPIFLLARRSANPKNRGHAKHSRDFSISGRQNSMKDVIFCFLSTHRLVNIHAQSKGDGEGNGGWRFTKHFYLNK